MYLLRENLKKKKGGKPIPLPPEGGSLLGLI